MDTKDSTSDLIHAFRSERLQYRKADETDADYKAIIAKVEQDPVTQALASPAILQPRRQKELDQYAENLARSLLGVTICLLPEEATRFRAQSGVEVDEDGVNSQIVIGVMALGGGGIPPSVAHHRTAALGIRIASPYQNRGYGREALNWMLDWAFRHAALHTVSITAASFNPRGIHLYQELGFSLEGRRRETIWFNRGWHDELEFGMTERDWEEVRRISASGQLRG